MSKKIEQSANEILKMEDELSIGAPLSRERRQPTYPVGHFEQEDYGSLAFNWNNYNSNIGSNFFNNNSNTILHNNGGLQNEGRVLGFGAMPEIKQNVIASNYAKNPSNNKSQDKLSSIRNYINMIEKEGDGSPARIENTDKQEKSVKEEPAVKKEVKVVPIIRKKNQN